MNYYIRVKKRTEKEFKKIIKEFTKINPTIRIIPFYSIAKIYYLDKGKFMSYSRNTFEYTIKKFGLVKSEYKELYLTKTKKLYIRVLN